MKARLRALERALVLELTEIGLAEALEKLKGRWDRAASEGGPEPSSFDLADALRDAGVSGIPALRHARDDGGPDCATIFKMLLRGSPVPATLERPQPAVSEDSQDRPRPVPDTGRKQ